MSRKHYGAVAAEIKRHAQVFTDNIDASGNPEFYRGGSHAITEVAEGLARIFAHDNPNFDRARFLVACGINR